MTKIKKVKSCEKLELELLRKERLMEYGLYTLIATTGALLIHMAHEFDTGSAQMLVENLTNETMSHATGATGLGLTGLSAAGFISSRFINKERRERINELKMETMPYERCICIETEDDIKMSR